MSVETRLEAGFETYVAELTDLCSIPSVSADPAYAAGIADAAAWLVRRLERAGFEHIELLPTAGHPAIVADWLHAPAAPTVLVYGHYDVQPPDPEERWRSPPFAPEQRDGRLYARGASDDKGPLLIPILVAEAFLTENKSLPVNLKLLIEGEEEMGSAHLGALVEANAERLAADALVSADGAMWRYDLPSVTVASRGIAALELTVRGAAKDLHSGRHGGSAPNPLHGLAAMIATLHDSEGRVSVPGFADGVREADPLLRRAIAGLDTNPDTYYAAIGAERPTWIADGPDLLDRQWLQPTLDVNGLWGGYQGRGSKTVIPAEAHAKITCRLVPGQEPRAVLAALEAHLRRVCPTALTVDIHPDTEHAARAYAVDPKSPVLAAAEAVLTELWGRPPLRVAMGATLPIAELFQRVLGLDTVFFSFATSDEDYHAPNEFFRLERFRDGLKAWAALFQRLGELDIKAR